MSDEEQAHRDILWISMANNLRQGTIDACFGPRVLPWTSDSSPTCSAFIFILDQDTLSMYPSNTAENMKHLALIAILGLSAITTLHQTHCSSATASWFRTSACSTRARRSVSRSLLQGLTVTTGSNKKPMALNWWYVRCLPAYYLSLFSPLPLR